MKKITILIVLGLLCLNFCSIGQAKPDHRKALQVGDTIPDIELRNVLNYKTKSLRLSDFNDKLVIIDVWATWCSPCIRAMPENYALQKRHVKDVLFLLLNPKISRDKPEQIKQFLDQRKDVFNFPSLVSDTVITNLFKIRSMGTYLWVRRNVVVAITGEEELTDQNINKMVAGPIKLNDTSTYSFNYRKPLFFEDNGGPQQQPYIFRSLLLPYADGYKGSGYDQDSSGKVNRIFSFNSSRINLILQSDPGFNGLSTAHLKIFVNDREKLMGVDNSRAARIRNLVSYEAIFPPVAKEQAWSYYKADIKRYLPYDYDTVRIKDTCWVLKLNTNAKLKSGSGKSETNLDERSGLPVQFNNLGLISLTMAIEDEFRIPVYDETRYEGNVNLVLPPFLKDTTALIKMLNKQGLDLSKELRESKYLVIRDRKDTQ